MKAAPVKKSQNVTDLQEALGIFYAELTEEYAKVQEYYLSQAEASATEHGNLSVCCTHRA